MYDTVLGQISYIHSSMSGIAKTRVAMVRENYLENIFFSRSVKSQQIFFGWSGKFRKDLESQGKRSEFFPLRVTPKFEVIQLGPLN